MHVSQEWTVKQNIPVNLKGGRSVISFQNVLTQLRGILMM